MAVQTEEKKLKVKKGKISNGLKEEATIKPVSLDFVGEKSKDAPLTKLEVSQMKEALMAFKKLVELHDSEEVKKKDLLGSACGEGRKVQVSVAAIKLPREADAQVHEIDQHEISPLFHIMFGQVLKLPLPHPTTPVIK